MRTIPVSHTDTASPSAYPKPAMLIGGEGRDTVVRQSGIRGRVMDKIRRAFFPEVKSSFHRSYPQTVIGINIHGIDRIRRQRTGITCMNGVTQQQPTGSQTGYSPRLCTYPDMSMKYSDTMYEITLQRRVTFCGPCRKTVCQVIIDVNTKQRAYQQMIVRCYCQARQENMRKRSRRTGMMILIKFLLIRIIAEESHVGCNPHDVITFQDIGDIMVLQWFQQGRYLFTHQFPVFLHQPVKTAIYANPRFSITFQITDRHVEHSPRMRIGTYPINLPLSLKRHKTDLLIVDNPDTTDGITVTPDGRPGHQLLKFRMVRHHSIHRPQVDDIDTLIERNPKSMEIILSNTSARLTVQIQSRLHETIAVITHQSTSKGGYPKEAV